MLASSTNTTGLPDDMRNCLIVAAAFMSNTDTDASEDQATSFPTIPVAEMQKLQQEDPAISHLFHYWNLECRPTRRQRQQETRPIKKLLSHCSRIKECHGVLYLHTLYYKVGSYVMNFGTHCKMYHSSVYKQIVKILRTS